MKSVSITEARNNLATLVAQVAYGDEQVLIEKMGKPIAVLVNIKKLNLPIRKEKITKPPSASAGIISLSHKINIREVFKVIKEPYDKKSLFGC